MAFPNEHSANVKDSTIFEPNSFDRKNIDEGVDVVIGKVADEDTLVDQSYRFDKEKFTAEEAKQWMLKMGIEILSFEAAAVSESVGHIYIYGIISPEKSKPGAKRNHIGLTAVVAQILQNQDKEILRVHINSEGGDVHEGFDIYEALVSSGKQIETIGEGIVASIATVIFLAGTTRTMSQNAEFIIHNPWSAGKGDSAAFQEAADSLKLIEDRLLVFYNEKTGTAPEILKKLMERETIFTASQSKDYGFATQVSEVYKAVALFNTNIKTIEMTKDELTVEMDKKFEGFFSKIKNLFGKAKALVLTTGDGTMLDFGEDIQEESEIVVGSTAKLEEGSAPEGDYVMTDGKTISFAAGVVTAITEAEPNAPDAEEMARITAENEALKAENEALTAQNAEYVGNIATVKAEFTTLKGQIKSDMETFYKENKLEDEKPDTGRHLYKKRD